MENNTQQHSLIQSITLHLLPGICILVAFVLLAPILDRLGFPSTMALFIIIGIVLVPVELGILLYQGKKSTGKFTLKGVVLYREPLPKKQYIGLGIILFIWLMLILMVVFTQIENFIAERFFFWLPDWFFLTEFIENFEQYPQSVIVVTAILGVLFNGLAGPVVEELYFRGYLLPRISRYGKWAPLLNAILFAVYHIFSPWRIPGIIVAMIPFVYVAWWKRNIYIGMIVHCAANTLSSLAIFALLFRPV
ncbi:MAG: CPBP family intramembrane metalloprotease [Anaerolineaceae bacterium]|nr:CPBP family intramembrane metalloprotease [Anaerolineaceae bacterium]